MPVLKFSTLLGGVFIEVLSDKRTGEERCFRFDDKGNAEWASLSDVNANGERARFFHHVFKERDFIFA